MPDDRQKELSVLRLENAKRCLMTAQSNAEIGDYKAAANRSYYAIFNAMRAVLAIDGFDAKKHSGVISVFRRLYIKNGVLPEILSEIIAALFEVRNESDYNDFFLITFDEVHEQIVAAETFIGVVEKFLDEK